jgi:hypothetical protein
MSHDRLRYHADRPRAPGLAPRCFILLEQQSAPAESLDYAINFAVAIHVRTLEGAHQVARFTPKPGTIAYEA